MIFWIVLLVAAGALGVALARPLLRAAGPADAAARADYDMTVYRDQLAEIERDRARGVLSDDQAQAAKLEVERRLLAAAAERAAPPPRRAASTPLVAAGLALAVPALAVALYVQLGRPGLPGQPLAERRDLRAASPPQGAQQQAADPHAAGGNAESMVDLTERLAKRLEQSPGDAEGWSLLARSYQQLDRHRDAVAALERAVALTNREPAMLSALGEARIMAAEGTVPEQARAEFEEVLKHSPKDPRARFYVAMAEGQAGRMQESLDRLVALARDTPADAPFLPMVRDRIAGLAQELKQDPARVLAAVPQPVAPPPGQQALMPPQPPAQGAAAPERGPTAADIAAAQQMSPEQRQEMIRGMISGLAQRLDANPGDVEGWLRLIRAYKVQGDDAKASAAAGKAVAANPAERARIVAMAQQLGVGVPSPAAAAPAGPAPPSPAPPQAPAAPRGPTSADVAAAQSMTPEQRQQMIRGMVDGLAQRMAESPNDVPGWMRLIRAYKVMGDDAKALEAAAKAVAANPAAHPQISAAVEQLGMTMPGSPAAAAGSAPRPLDAAAIRSGAPPGDVAGLRKRLDGNPNDREALFQVGLAEAAQGNKIAAAEHWGRLLGQLDPASAEYAALRERLDALKRGG